MYRSDGTGYHYGGKYDAYLNYETWLNRGQTVMPPEGYLYSLQTFYALCMSDFLQLMGARQEPDGRIIMQAFESFDLRTFFGKNIGYYTYPLNLTQQENYRERFRQLRPDVPGYQAFPAGEDSRRVPVFNYHTSDHSDYDDQNFTRPLMLMEGQELSGLFHYIINTPDGHGESQIEANETPREFIGIVPYDPFCDCCAPTTPIRVHPIDTQAAELTVYRRDTRDIDTIVHRYRLNMLFYLEPYIVNHYKTCERERRAALVSLGESKASNEAASVTGESKASDEAVSIDGVDIDITDLITRHVHETLRRSQSVQWRPHSTIWDGGVPIPGRLNTSPVGVNPSLAPPQTHVTLPERSHSAPPWQQPGFDTSGDALDAEPAPVSTPIAASNPDRDPEPTPGTIEHDLWALRRRRRVARQLVGSPGGTTTGWSQAPLSPSNIPPIQFSMPDTK